MDETEEMKLTKKEKRELARKEKMEEKEKEEKSVSLQKLLIGLGILAVIFYFGYKTYKYFTTPVEQIVANTINVQDNDHIKGNENATVTLLEFADFQCPACVVYYPTVQRLEKEYGEKVKFIFRNYPLTQIHPNAMFAAQAAEAAGKQGKFWEMHDLLFEKHDEWADESDPTAKISAYAKDLGLDEKKLIEDAKSQEVADKIKKDIDSGNSLGITGTPSFFLDGRKVQPRSYEEFKSLIDTALSK